jgi:hypothetical protein
MALGQLTGIAALLDREPTGAVGPLKVLEAVDGDAARAGDELEQARLALGGPGADALPEPLDHLVVGRVPTVVSKFDPIVNVDCGKR